MRFKACSPNRLCSLAIAFGLLLSASQATVSLSAVIEPADLDKSTDACEDFYQFACGGWIARAQIPEDRPEWSRGFATLTKQNEELLRTALEQYANGKLPVGDNEAKLIGDYYAACMDEDGIEKKSLASLKRRLESVEVIKDKRALAIQVARYHLEGASAIFGFGAGQDYKDSSQMIADADQGGLTLPDRDYYLSDEKRFDEIRSKFRSHVHAMLKLYGETEQQAKKDADIILTIETELAKVSADKVMRRDPNAMYNRLDRDGLVKLAPSFDWDTYFATLGYPGLKAINVDVPKFFVGVENLLKTVPMDHWRTYLRWHGLHAGASAFSKSFVDEDFNFVAKALTGQPQIKPRWKRCVNSTLEALGQPLGKVFVSKTFSPNAKVEAQQMIKAIESAMGQRLKALDWMDQATREQADQKLHTIVNQIGYPDKWRDFSGLKIGRDNYYANAVNASAFNSRFYLDKIGRPVDRGEWHMPPSMVNAYYSADNNKMVFPAGILQTPFYQEGRPAALNFGGIGMVMGHELTHGFDDQGRKFDAKGNLRDWWSPKVGEEFDHRAECIVDQYSKFVAVDDVHVNGKLTLGENIADQGGIRLAFDAWKRTAEKDAESIDGFTPAQQFYIGYAQTWCQKMRPEMARLRATTDPHSPARYRVNGPLSNYDEFSKAFSCKEGAAMNPQSRCRVW
jgi:endothelin-converting enzyme/putative endopeptidase